jgi:hypothetical protein
MGVHEHDARTRTEKLIDALQANTKVVEKQTLATERAESELRRLRETIENGKTSPLEGL